jgi:hypothetical protein
MDKHTRRLRNRHELIVFIEDGNQNVFVNGDLFAHETSSGYNWPASDTQESGAGTVLEGYHAEKPGSIKSPSALFYVYSTRPQTVRGRKVLTDPVFNNRQSQSCILTPSVISRPKTYNIKTHQFDFFKCFADRARAPNRIMNQNQTSSADNLSSQLKLSQDMFLSMYGIQESSIVTFCLRQF